VSEYRTGKRRTNEERTEKRRESVKELESIYT
jgi:hypothetical protein